MTIDFLIFGLGPFLREIRSGKLQIQDLDRALLFSEVSMPALREEAKKYFAGSPAQLLEEFLTKLKVAQKDGRVSTQPIGRKNDRTYTELYNFLGENKYEISIFGKHPDGAIIDRHHVAKSAKNAGFSLTIIY